MSDINLGTATGRLELDASGVERGISRASSALQQLEPVVRNNWWGLRNLGTSFAGVGAAIAGTFVGAVEAAVSWETALAGVERTTFDTTKSTEENAAALKGLEGQLRSLATTQATPAIELAKIAEEAGALGIAQKDIAGFTKTVSEMGATTDLSTQEAATGLARISGILGLSSDDFDKLGSAILETGRSTQATEPEIVSLSTRLSGIAATVGLTADQLVGLAATVASVGIRAEMGGTAIQKTFLDMLTAISAGGNQLELFGKIAGRTGSEFAQLFHKDAAQALTLFVAGLGKLQSKGTDITALLSSLGITEARQIATLLRLAAAQDQTANQATRLSNNLKTSADAFGKGTSLQEIYERRVRTTAAQIQLLKNQILLVGQAIGSAFLGPLKGAVNVIGAFLKGLNGLPPPLRNAYLIILGLIGTVAAFGAALLLLLPRIVLVRQALAELGIAGTLAGRQVGSAATQLSLFGAGGAAAEAGASRLAGAAKFGGKALGILGLALTAATVATTLFGVSQGKQEKSAKDSASANKDLVASLAQAGAAGKRAASTWIDQQLAMGQTLATAARLGIALETLKAIIQGTASADVAKGFVDAVTNAAKRGDAGAKELGDRVRDLYYTYQKSSVAALKASAATDDLKDSNDAAAQSFEKVRDAAEKAQEAYDKIEGQNQAILSLVDALFSQRDAAFAVEDAQKAYNEAVASGEEEVLALARAELELQQARLSYESQVLEVRKAEADLAEARQKEAEELQKAEEDLSKAQRRSADLLKKVGDAEKKLVNARADERERMNDAADALVDANDRYTESLEKVKDAEAELLRVQMGPTLDDIRNATIKLSDAENDLVDAHQAVADAEWQLQYLRQEGAGARDIAEAEQDLAKANTDVLKANDDLIDSQEEYNKVMAGPDPAEIAKAEEELTRARHDAERAARDLTQRENELADARQAIVEDRAYKEAMDDLQDAQAEYADSLRDIRDKERDVQRLRDEVANDTAYKDALTKLQQAQLQLRDAEIRMQEQEIALRKERAKSLDQGQVVAKAALDLEKALYNQAKANVEVQKQQALARGELFDSGREAQALRGELLKLAGSIDGPLADSFANMASILSGGVPQGKRPEIPKKDDFVPDLSGIDPGDLEGSFGDLGDALGDVGTELDKMNDKVKKTPDIWDTVFKVLAGIVGQGLASFIISQLSGALAGSAAGTLLGGPIGTLVGFILGIFISWLITKFGPGVADWFTKNVPKLFTGFWSYLQRLPGLIAGWIPQLIGAFVGFIASLPGLFVKGAQESVNDFIGILSKLPGLVGFIIGYVLGTIAEFGSKLLGLAIQAGSDYYGGIVDWISKLPGKLREIWDSVYEQVTERVTDIYNSVANWLQNLPETILNWFANLPQNMRNIWGQFKEAVRDGVEGAINWVQQLPGRLLNAIGDLGSMMWNKGVEFIHGIINGLNAASPGLGNAAWNVVNTILGIVSRLPTEMWNLGIHAIESMGRAIEAMAGFIGQVANNIKNSIVDTLDPRNWWSTPEEHYRPLFADAFKSISEEANKSKSAVARSVGKIIEAATVNLGPGTFDTSAFESMRDQLAMLQQQAQLQSLQQLAALNRSAAADRTTAAGGDGAAAGGDTFNIKTIAQDPEEIAREIAWRQRRSRRG